MGADSVRWALVWLARLALAGVFVTAAVLKIMDVEAFATTIYHYRILPDHLVNLAAIYLPWIEVAAAIGLLVPSLRHGSLALVAAMLVVFIIAMGSTMARGIDLADCGCFSAEGGEGVGPVNLLRNVGLLVLAGISALRDRGAGPAEAEPVEPEKS